MLGLEEKGCIRLGKTSGENNGEGKRRREEMRGECSRTTECERA